MPTIQNWFTPEYATTKADFIIPSTIISVEKTLSVQSRHDLKANRLDALTSVRYPINF